MGRRELDLVFSSVLLLARSLTRCEFRGCDGLSYRGFESGG